MKKLLILSILFLLLSYTGKSQSITVENNKLCFDSAACVELYKTILDNEGNVAELKLYEELYTSYDSLLINKEKYTSFLQKELARTVSENASLQTIYANTLLEHKKQKRRLIYSLSLVTTVLLSIIFFR